MAFEEATLIGGGTGAAGRAMPLSMKGNGTDIFDEPTLPKIGTVEIANDGTGIAA